MSKKSTATKTTATTKSAATKSSRKSSTARTKLPEAKPEAVESSVEVVEVAPAQAVTPTEVTTGVKTEVVVEAQPVALPEEPAIIEAMAPPARTLSRDELEAIIRREAYMRAQQRGFRNGSPLEDWVAAESEVRAKLTAEGASLPAA